jgi:hypothetical protein
MINKAVPMTSAANGFIHLLQERILICGQRQPGYSQIGRSETAASGLRAYARNTYAGKIDKVPCPVSIPDLLGISLPGQAAIEEIGIGRALGRPAPGHFLLNMPSKSRLALFPISGIMET